MQLIHNRRRFIRIRVIDDRCFAVQTLKVFRPSTLGGCYGGGLRMDNFGGDDLVYGGSEAVWEGVADDLDY